MTLDTAFFLLGLWVVASPAALLAAFGVTSLSGQPLSERSMSRFTHVAVITGLTTALALLGLMLAFDRRSVPIELGNWVVISEQHFHFHLKFVFDRLSVPFVILTYVLCGTIGVFTSRYLHRDPGFGRFFLLYAIFLLGMIVASLAGTIETMFFGWELVGLSSALLAAFFHERPNPVRNGLRVWTVYRISDAAFLIAAISLHHSTGAGDFDALMGTGPWPEGHASLTASTAGFVGFLLLIAAAGKSALIPFSGWLPRAMEGPTPSSAVFYGALSVHLGAFLLLRVSPILGASLLLSLTVFILGLLTAMLGTLTARVQSDIKSALAFASLTQVGIIVAEIGGIAAFTRQLSHLGIDVTNTFSWLYYIPLIHIIGHACLRTLQLLRAPSLLHDYHSLENAIGSHLTHGSSFWEQMIPKPCREWLYRVSIERGFLDAILDTYIVRPFILAFRWSDRLERRWTDFLSGRESRESDHAPRQSVSPEEFL